METAIDQTTLMRLILEKGGKLEGEYDYWQAYVAGSYASKEEVSTIRDRMVEIKAEAAKLSLALQTGNIEGLGIQLPSGDDN